MATHVAMVSCSSEDSVRGLPSIMGSRRCLTWPSRPLIQPPLQPSALLPHTTGASMAAMTSIGQVLLVATPPGQAVVRSKDRSGPSSSGVRMSSTHRGEQMFLGDRHEWLGALAEDAGLLGHGHESSTRAFLRYFVPRRAVPLRGEVRRGCRGIAVHPFTILRWSPPCRSRRSPSACGARVDDFALRKGHECSRCRAKRDRDLCSR